MAMKYYVDQTGKYLGGMTAGALPPPANSTEVPSAPRDARMKWDGSQWVVPVGIRADIVGETRRGEYLKNGVTPNAMLFALWDKANGDSTKFDDLQAKIDAVNLANPLP